MRYKQVTVKADHNEADLVSYAMIESGSAGASVADGEDIKEVLRSKGNWDYYDESLAGELHSLRGVLTKMPIFRRWKKLCDHISEEARRSRYR